MLLCAIWTEDLERRAALMRERHRATANTTPDSTATRGRRDGKSTSKTSAVTRMETIKVPSLPEAGPYTLLRGVWKPAHTGALLEALGDVDPLVARTARSIGKQQVGFDGLISMGGADVLEVRATPQAMPHALQLYNLLLVKARERGGEVTAKNGSSIRLRGESITIRLRESVDRREDWKGQLSFHRICSNGALVVLCRVGSRRRLQDSGCRYI